MYNGLWTATVNGEYGEVIAVVASGSDRAKIEAAGYAHFQATGQDVLINDPNNDIYTAFTVSLSR